MTVPAVRYAVLRYQRDWDGVTLSGLVKKDDGALTLARVPAPAGGQAISLPSPFDAEPSGIAVGACNDLFLSDTANNRVIFIDEICNAQTILPGCDGSGSALGQFNAPRGLLVHDPGGLYVCDSGNGRVQVFRLPTLELHEVWDQLLQNPTCLATDSQSRIYVLDRGSRRVLRFSARGVPDAAYNSAMSLQPGLTSPFSLATGSHDVLYVADDQSDSVLSFDVTGKALAALPKINLASPVKPRALAAHSRRLYVADSSSGQIWVYDSASGAYIGPAANFRGPVAAMSFDGAGTTLYIKPGADETFFRLRSEAAYISAGKLIAGPLDAGQRTEWERVHAQAETPANTKAQLLTFVSGDPAKVPADSEWTPATGSALDILVPPVPGTANGTPGQKRYLWLQLQLSSLSAQASPTLIQVQAQTTGDSYLHHLPAVYRKEDLPHRFLERWLALFRSELGDLELLLDDMPRLFDPATTPEEFLEWLSGWLAFEFPNGKNADEKRALLMQALDLNARRGTPSGIHKFIDLYAGVKAHIFEAFRERRVWQLDATSTLGFDTALAPSAPEGMIVGGLVPPDSQYFGLQGDYYDGPNFNALATTRTDPAINFDWGANSPDPSIKTADQFSVRWSGQIQSRYSERYTFSISSKDGARLWVDDIPIIDNWTRPQKNEVSGAIALTAGRWYAITLEYYRSASASNGPSQIRLSWASRSQSKEIVPQSRLYSVLDDSVNLDVAALSPGCGTLLVGQAVVGETGPLQASQFGTPLFSDTAHLFTVSLPAARIPKIEQRKELRRVIEAEKPAHTDFHLCFVEPRMRVGFQARIGVNTIIAGLSEPMRLEGTLLGLDSVLGGEPGQGEAGRVGERSRLGQDTVIG